MTPEKLQAELERIRLKRAKRLRTARNRRYQKRLKKRLNSAPGPGKILFKKPSEYPLTPEAPPTLADARVSPPRGFQDAEPTDENHRLLLNAGARGIGRIQPTAQLPEPLPFFPEPPEAAVLPKEFRCLHGLVICQICAPGRSSIPAGWNLTARSNPRGYCLRCGCHICACGRPGEPSLEILKGTPQ